MRASTTHSLWGRRSQMTYGSLRCQGHCLAPITTQTPLCHPATKLLQRSKLPSWLRGSRCQWQALTRKGRGGRSRGRRAVCPVALVAVEWNPAVFIGLGLVGGGLVLYQLRSLRPELSRDFDIVASSVLIFSGGILITQGWRMDPIIIFENLLMTGLLMTWTIEALRLREQLADRQAYEVQDERTRQPERAEPGRSRFGFGLPPPQRPAFTRWDPEGVAEEARSSRRGWPFGDAYEEENVAERTGRGDEAYIGGRRLQREGSIYAGEYSDASRVPEDYVDDGRGFYDDGERDISSRPSTRGPDPGTRERDNWTSDDARSQRGYNASRDGRDVGTYRYEQQSYRDSQTAGRGAPTGEEQYRRGPVRGRDIEEDWE